MTDSLATHSDSKSLNPANGNHLSNMAAIPPVVTRSPTVQGVGILWLRSNETLISDLLEDSRYTYMIMGNLQFPNSQIYAMYVESADLDWLSALLATDGAFGNKIPAPVSNQAIRFIRNGWNKHEVDRTGKHTAKVYKRKAVEEAIVENSETE